MAMTTSFDLDSIVKQVNALNLPAEFVDPVMDLIVQREQFHENEKTILRQKFEAAETARDEALDNLKQRDIVIVHLSKNCVDFMVYILKMDRDGLPYMRECNIPKIRTIIENAVPALKDNTLCDYNSTVAFVMNHNVPSNWYKNVLGSFNTSDAKVALGGKNTICMSKRNSQGFALLVMLLAKIYHEYPKYHDKGNTNVTISCTDKNISSEHPISLVKRGKKFTINNCKKAYDLVRNMSYKNVESMLSLSASDMKQATTPIQCVYTGFIIHGTIPDNFELSQEQFDRMIARFDKYDLYESVNSLLKIVCKERNIKSVSKITRSNAKRLFINNRPLATDLYRTFHVITTGTDFAGNTSHSNPAERLKVYNSNAKDNGKNSIFGVHVPNCYDGGFIMTSCTQFDCTNRTIDSIELTTRTALTGHECFNQQYNLTVGGKFYEHQVGDKGEFAANFDATPIIDYRSKETQEYLDSMREKKMAQVRLTDKNILGALQSLHTKENTFPGEISHTFLDIDFTKAGNTLKRMMDYRANYIHALNAAIWDKHDTKGKGSYELITDSGITTYNISNTQDSKEMIQFLGRQLEDNFKKVTYPMDLIKATQLGIDLYSVDLGDYHFDVKIRGKTIPLGTKTSVL